MFSDSWVVGVNVYGSSPIMFKVIRKIIKEARIVAHLCPPWFRGSINCWVNRLINHP